ncbi:hypothetical protein HPP05_37115 [Corallococcus exiguus]|uniref:hypothetical protein n=1 Tax=Corallococcus exiguus TaxID=83462 RepID=UPI0014947BB0|nr:hypothetical protein [Corallococcus exiguus]NPC75383.1 hypothetical protein [Corallococcus exiguus]
MAPVNVDNVDQARAEFDRLRTLLEEVCPGYDKSLKPVALEPEAPAAVRALWDAVGYSSLFHKLLAIPDVRSSRKAAAAVLTEWSADARKMKGWGGQGPSLERLPARFRLVDAPRGAQTRSLWITDESEQPVDPPVLSVDARTGKHSLMSPSYVAYVVELLVRAGFSVGPSRCGTAFQSPPPGEPYMPLTAPQVSQIGEGLWRVVEDPNPPPGDPELREFIGYTSLDRFIHFMHEPNGLEVRQTGAPRGDKVVVEGVDEATARGLGLRWFTSRYFAQVHSQAVGWLEGVAVWMKQVGPATYEFTVDPESRRKLVDWARRRGWKVQSMSSWKELYTGEGGGIFFG